MANEITVDLRGPMFKSGAYDLVFKDICDQAQEAVADKANERVHYFLNKQIKHPTPYYETQIIHQRRNDTDIVHDRGIVYGPWLEGTSRRNSTTRFKGYASFRKARDEVQKLSPEIVDRVIKKNLARLS